MLRKLLIGAAFIVSVGALSGLPWPIGDTTRIFTLSTIHCDAQEVFAFVTTPGNWPRWHPSSRSVSGATDHSLAVGERVTEDFVVAGRKGRAVWTVLEREAPRRWVIDGKVEGGGQGRITYTLERHALRTRVCLPGA